MFAALLGLGAPAALAAPRAECVSTGTGNWNAAATWTCGRVPNNGDNVTINNGHTVTLDTNGSAYQLIVNGTLNHASGMQSLNVGAGGVRVNVGGTFFSPKTLNIAGNLTNNGDFVALGCTIVMNGTAPQSIGGSNLMFGDLTINNSAGVNLTTDAMVFGLLTLNYDLNVSSGYALTMGGNAATTQGDADVVGKTKRTYLSSGMAYSLGSPYTTIRFASGGTLPSEINVQLFKSAPGGLGNAVQRYYSITPSGGSGYTFDLKLHYRDSELNGNDEDKLQMWQQVDGSWTQRSVTSRDTSNNWVEKTGLNSFSLWALAAPRDVCVSNGSGNWDTAGTWSCSHVPTGSDIVIINDGHTVTMTTDAAASQLIVGVGSSGMLTHGTGSQTLTVGAGGVSVSNGATFNAPETLNIAGNLTNNGTLTSSNGTLTINDGNFTNSGTFNHNNGTLAMSGSAVKSIGGANLTFYNLTINNSAGVNLTNNATVNGTLTLNYDLNVSSGYVLTMGSSATTQGNADVVGKTRRAHTFTSNTPYTFGSQYTTIRFTDGTPPSEITVELFKSAPGGLANAAQRYYSITPTGGSGYTFNLQLHYRDTELSGINENNLQMWQQVNGRWTLRARTDNSTTENWVQKTGLDSFSLWALSDSGAPTAVTLSTFDARADAPSALPFVGLGALAVMALGVVVWRRTMNQ